MAARSDKIRQVKCKKPAYKTKTLPAREVIRKVLANGAFL